jgi:hypothetical protein
MHGIIIIENKSFLFNEVFWSGDIIVRVPVWAEEFERGPAVEIWVLYPDKSEKAPFAGSSKGEANYSNDKNQPVYMNEVKHDDQSPKQSCF